MSSFNIKRDNEIVADGGFFCEACLVGRKAEERSKDKRYCLSCYESLKEEVKSTSSGDHWAADNNIFIHHGMKYGVEKDGRTVCIGKVATEEMLPDATKTTPAPPEVVAKPLDKGIIAPPTIKRVLQHGGRPRKPLDEPIHRTTKWRREKQGILL